MIRDSLDLTTVQVAREAISSDGMGGVSAVTTLTTLGFSQIWQNSGGSGVLSDKISKISSHVLAVETDTYVWTDTDRWVVNGSDRYKVTGRPDDVSHKGDLTVVGLEIVT